MTTMRRFLAMMLACALMVTLCAQGLAESRTVYAARNDAKVYDRALATLYNGGATSGAADAQGMFPGKFNLKTVDQLEQTNKAKSNAVHYGDWPAPETFVTNTKAA